MGGEGGCTFCVGSYAIHLSYEVGGGGYYTLEILVSALGIVESLQSQPPEDQFDLRFRGLFWF